MLSRQQSRRRFATDVYLAGALLALVVFWFICFFLVALQWQSTSLKIQSSPLISVQNSKSGGDILVFSHFTNQKKDDGKGIVIKNEHPLAPHILSRSGTVIASSDVRGNLGPPSVVVQPKPGKDWLHDRWQAASDMHGKNIPGEHWIQLEFESKIVADSIVLDWETAYADKYVIEGSLEPISSSRVMSSSERDKERSEKVWVLFDGTDPTQSVIRSESKSGQSPGTKQKLPLHILHTISPLPMKKPVRYLRLHILKSATGWGVSLWQWDVYGFLENESLQ